MFHTTTKPDSFNIDSQKPDADPAFGFIKLTNRGLDLTVSQAPHKSAPSAAKTPPPSPPMGLRMDDLHAPTVGSGPTSSTYSNATQTKQTLPQLIAEKENLEAELSALSSVLDSHGVDMRTSLTTFDGFPRSDIDVPQIRTTRARIIHLKNDHKALMVKLEDAVHEQFAAGKAPENMSAASSQSYSNGVTAFTPPAPVVEPPFARVNSVVPGSPAEESGLHAGDKITRFGTVNWQNHERLGKVAQVVQQNENVSRECPLIAAHLADLLSSV